MKLMNNLIELTQNMFKPGKKCSIAIIGMIASQILSSLTY